MPYDVMRHGRLHMRMTVASSDPRAGAVAANPPDEEGGSIRFIMGGVQKCGTTALAHYLAQHPCLALPKNKEAHVFDAPGFDDTNDTLAVDRLFSQCYRDDTSGRIRGDATPITLMYPGAIERVARYNPNMRWVIVLRDPVSRAVSHYHMQRRTGNETLPLMAAVLVEPLRLRGRLGRHSKDWALRKFSYVLRGRYTSQLDRLFLHFPEENILLVRSRDLREQPAVVADRVCTFLSIPPMPASAVFSPVFEGNYRKPSRWSPGVLLLRWLLRRESSELARRYGIDL